MSQTDFNDLHVAEGLAVVRHQVTKAIESAKAKPAANDMPVYDEGGYGDYPEADGSEISSDSSSSVSTAQEFTIEQMMKRFAITVPNAQIWDAHTKQLFVSSKFKSIYGKKLVEEWLARTDKRKVDQDVVKAEVAAAQKEGRGGLSAALRRYVYLYPETSVWDRDKRQVIPTNGLKVAIADCYEDWIKHPNREEIDIERLVFDPTQSVDPATHINMFRGLAIEPADSAKGCRGIWELINFLCNDDKLVFDWMMKWLAFPLQNVGAKMGSAVMMHSVVQGSGKSLFFDGVMRKIYGEYSATLGQHQLESQYTDWRSQMLWAVFEEIFSRDQKYSHTGTIKQMTTGETMRIEKKFVSGWEEANHMNGVFLSNEIQPFPVEPHDRRMLVVWPDGKLSESLKDRVVTEINGNGVHAFYRYLLDIDLGDFTTHTEPPMTAAKERLIDFGRPGWDLFYREWQRGGITNIPYITCLLSDLYGVYKRWCGEDNEKVLTKNKLSSFMGSMQGVRVRKDTHYIIGGTKHKGTFIQTDKVPEETAQGEWLGKCAIEFRKSAEKV